MGNQVQIFKNDEFGAIRVTNIDGEPYFVGRDIAEKLGYKKPQNAIGNHVDNDDTLKQGIIDNLGRTQQTVLINESGMYSLILGSKLENSKKFKKWVTSDVLPSVRKHGAYMTPETIKKTLTNPDFIIQLATQLKEEQTKRKIAEGEVGQFLDTNNLLKWDTVAKNLNIGKNTMLRELREMKILQTDEFYYKGIKSHGERHNVPYQAFMKYFEVKYKVNGDKRYPIVLVKAIGQEYLYKRLLKANIIQ